MRLKQSLLKQFSLDLKGETVNTVKIPSEDMRPQKLKKKVTVSVLKEKYVCFTVIKSILWTAHVW